MKPITFKKNLLISSMLFATFGLTACGGGGGSSDSGSTTNVQMSGAVVDDFVAYSFIYVDVNNNQKFDQAFEPYAYTDKDGYFSVAKDGTNYCALNPKTDYNYKYCLQGDASLKSGGVIRVEAGRDTLTTQVYEAAMSLVMNGDAESLRVTALTSGVEAINNTNLIAAAKTSLNLDDAQIATLQQQYGSYLSAYLKPSTTSSTRSTRGTNDTLTINLNKVDPLELDAANNEVSETDRAFKMAIQMHKLAEAIAAKMAPNPITVGTTTIKAKDLIPVVYFAMIKNLTTTDNTVDAVASLSLTTVMNDAIGLANQFFGTSIAAIAATDFITLNKYLNCTLSNEGDAAIDATQIDTTYGDTCSSILASDNNSARNKLYASELGTKGVIETSADLVNTFNKSKVVAQTGSTFDINTNDFVTSSANVIAGNDAAAPTVSFGDVLAEFETKHLYLSETNKDKFALYFSNTSLFAGDITVCQQETDGTNHLFKGKWAQNTDKNYMLNIEYLNQPITLKRLDATSINNSTSCGIGNQTCLVIEYPNLDSNTLSTQTNNLSIFTSSASLTASGLLVDGNNAPVTVDECFLNN